jgi:hypothetical protein
MLLLLTQAIGTLATRPPFETSLLLTREEQNPRLAALPAALRGQALRALG